MMNVNVIMFDLDGTLINTLPAIANSFNVALTKYNLKTFEIEEYKNFIGNGFSGVFDKISKILNIDKNEKEKFLKIVRDDYNKNYLKGISLYDGIEEVLDYLTENNKILAVITNKDDNLAKLHIEKMLNKWDFKYVYGASLDNSYPLKPNPYCVNKIESFGYEKEKMVFIGDMLVDIETANNANIKYIFCEYGYETKKINANIKIKKAKEIMEIIK